ncbi:tRNA wybutosine-synthesizing protein 4-like [Liolophura sinensis]|uniref:tRNA wybutosine-synthesizing protein 4-like n=1 Tax=Liolophura sinensis TaxID=3198878 RepID=UPI003158BE9A
MPTSNAKTQKSRHDTAVQGTNDSSIVSKCSMAKHGYFRDDFLHRFVAKEARRAPLIHRGYFIRARAIDYILREFLKQSTHQRKQIISLGAGFDSSFFRLASEGLLEDTVYIELDFPEVVKRKGEIILQTDFLNTDCYKLIGVDLSDLHRLEELMRLCQIKGDNPTLLLSECVLTYMMANSSTKIIKWANETFGFATFVLYEQINPDDAFGQVMVNHFTKIGSPLQCIHTYPTQQSQLERFNQAGWERGEALDMNQFYRCLVTQEERRRICDLEPFDEYEEWHLKCAHYMVLCAYNNDNRTRLLCVINSKPGASGDIDGQLCEPRSDDVKLLNIRPVPQPQKYFSIKSTCLHGGHSSKSCDRGDTDICQSPRDVLSGGGENLGGKGDFKSELCLLGSAEKKDSGFLETESTLEKVRRDISDASHFGTNLCEADSCETNLGKTNTGEIISCETDHKGSDTCEKIQCETISRPTVCKPQPKLVSFSDEQTINPSSCLLQRFGHSSVLIGHHIVTIGGFGNHANKHCRLQNGVVTDILTGKSVDVAMPGDFKLDVLHHTLVALETEGSILLLGGRHSPVKCNTQITKLELTLAQGHRCAASAYDVHKPRDTTADSREGSENVNLKEVPDHLDDRLMSSQSIEPGLIVSYQGNMENGRWRHTAVTHRSKVYVYGGRNETSPVLGECLVYDLSSHTWSQISALGQCPGSRHSHTAALWNGQMVIAGGVDQELLPLNSIHLLNVEEQHWVELKLTGHLKPRYSHTCHVVEDFLILVGGVNLDHSPPGLAVVNLLTGHCEEFDLPQKNGRDVVMYHKHSSIMVDSSRLMVIGGGGNCFSFGTHINTTPVVLDVGPCLRYSQG